MCLIEVYTDEDMNRIVEELPEVAPGVVQLVKTVVCGEECWMASEQRGRKYSFGINTNKCSVKVKADDDTEYWSNYHFSIKKPAFLQATDYYQAFNQEWIICLALKKWFTAAGNQTCKYGDAIRIIYKELMNVFIVSSAFFPTYPETEAKLEDFLAWLKENDPEYAESQLCEAAK